MTQIAEFREQSQALVTLAQRDLTDFWSSLDLYRDPFAARDMMGEFLPELTAGYGDAEALVAAEFYDSLRVVPPSAASFRAVLADPPSVPEQFLRTASWAVAPLLGDAPDPAAALSRFVGAVARLVMQPNRETITRSVARDRHAAGWERRTRAGSCRFCQMLAGRPGAVYKRETAMVAAHDNCKCVAVPSWDPNAPEVPMYAYVASKTTSGMSPEQRDKHRARVRDYLDANFPK